MSTTWEAMAKAEGVYLASGRGFFAQPADGRRYLRLSFSYLSPEDMRDGHRHSGAVDWATVIPFAQRPLHPVGARR